MRMQATPSPSRREGQKREAGRARRHWVCVCTRAVCARELWGTRAGGGAVDVFTWNHSPSDTQDSSEPGGEGAARPGRSAASPLSVPGGAGGPPGLLQEGVGLG